MEPRKSKTRQQWDFGLIGTEKTRDIECSSKLEAHAEIEPIAANRLLILKS
jgi:hypothetical protein